MSTPDNCSTGDVPEFDAPTPSVGTTPQAPSPFHSPVKRQQPAVNEEYASSSQSPSPANVHVMSMTAPPTQLPAPLDLLPTINEYSGSASSAGPRVAVDSLAGSRGTSGSRSHS